MPNSMLRRSAIAASPRPATSLTLFIDAFSFDSALARALAEVFAPLSLIDWSFGRSASAWTLASPLALAFDSELTWVDLDEPLAVPEDAADPDAEPLAAVDCASAEPATSRLE